MKKLLSIFSLSAISVLPIIGMASFASNKTEHEGDFYEYLNQPESSFATINKNQLLSPSEYSKIEKTSEAINKNYVSFVVIANKNIYLEVLPFANNQKIVDYLTSLDHIQFKLHDYGKSLGMFMQSFKIKYHNQWSSWQHGTSTAKLNEDYYPMYFQNHESASAGILSLVANNHDIYEITYNYQY